MYVIDKCMNPIRMDIEISICVRYYFNYKAKAKVICNKSLIHKYARTLVLKLQSIKSSNVMFYVVSVVKNRSIQTEQLLLVDSKSMFIGIKSIIYRAVFVNIGHN